MIINGTLWALGMEDAIKPDLDIAFVGPYQPTTFSMGGNVNDETRKEIKQLADTASKRGKRRFESMMDTGKSESIEY